MKTSQMPNAEISAILEEVNQKYADSMLTFSGMSERWPDEKIVRTGSLQLDMALGIGGWPRGRLNLVYGEESSGKTSLALHSVAQAQRAGLNVAYIDAENALSPNYMAKLGVDLKNLLVCQPSSLENAIDVMITLIETGKVHMIVLDSIPALRSSTVMEADAETETRALEARRWSVQIPRITKVVSEYNVCMLMINQVRDSMSMYGPAESLPGGRTLKFAFSTMVKIKKYQEGRQNDGIDYHEGRFDVTKNKVGSPYRKGSFYMVPGHPIDFTEDVFLTAVKYGVINEDMKYEDDELVSKKRWFSMPLEPRHVKAIREDDPDVPEDVTFTQEYNESKFRAKLEKWPHLIKLLEEDVLKTLNQQVDAQTGEVLSSDDDDDSEGDEDSDD